MWAVREIAENTLAVGYFNIGRFEIYVGNTLQKSVNVDLSIFGFIIPPTSPKGQMPRHLIALDNSRYSVIDL